MSAITRASCSASQGGSVETVTLSPFSCTYFRVDSLFFSPDGEVIITNDGDWSHKITSPKHNKFKTYLVETQEPINEEAIVALEQGVQLHNEKELTRPAIVEKLASYSLRLSICEGKYHQVKRMLAAVDNKVVELHREKIANIHLDENLASGEYRPLTAAELSL